MGEILFGAVCRAEYILDIGLVVQFYVEIRFTGGRCQGKYQDSTQYSHLFHNSSGILV